MRQVPYEYRVKQLINTYRSNPHLFNDDQLDELEEIAKEQGINFKPMRQEISLRRVTEQLTSGFLEGMTTIPVGEKPRTTYESIAHSLGHLVGFAPGILAGPLSATARGAVKLGAKITGRELTERQLARESAESVIGQVADLTAKNISVPMLFGDWVKKGAELGIKNAKLDAFDFMKKGAATRDILMQMTHLGAGMGISNIWKGPDAWLQGIVGGSVAGGFFGGLSNFRAIGNLLKHGGVKQYKTAEQQIKMGVGALAMGGPAHVRGEPIEAVLYETILGGYFGYKGRPAVEAEGGKFISELIYYPKKDIIFTPEFHPKFKDYSKGAQEYIMNTSVEQASTYLKNQYPDISEAEFNQYFKELAQRHLGKKDPTEKEIQDMMRQEATQHYYENFEYVKDPFETSERPIDPEHGQKEDSSQPTEKAPENPNLEAQKDRYQDKEVYVIETDGGLYTINKVKGEYRESRVGESRIDTPIENFEGKEYTEIHNVYEPTGGRFWKKYPLFGMKIVKGSLEPMMDKEGWWRITSSLNEKNKYIALGVKAKGIGQVTDYHIDVNNYTVEQLRKAANISEKEFLDSLEITAEFYGKDKNDPDLISLHEKQWKSNLLSTAEGAGFYLKGSNDLSGLRPFMEVSAKNVTDANKRFQLDFDKGAPLPEDVFTNAGFAHKGIRFTVLNDRIDMGPKGEDVYTVKNEKGEIETKYNESNTDGTLVFTPEVFDTIMKSIGLPHEAVGMNKPVIMLKIPGQGIFMAKSAGAVGDGSFLKMMYNNELQMVVFKSAAKKLPRNIKPKDYTYDEKNDVYEIKDFIKERDIFELDPTAVRMNLGTFENPKKMYGTHFVKQFFGNLNEIQTPGIMQGAYNEYFYKTYIGDRTTNENVEAYLLKPDNKLLKGLDVDKMSLELIHRIMRDHYNSEVGKRIRKHIYRLDKENELREVEEFTKEEYRDYLARNNRLLDITQASESSTKLFKSTRKYSEKVYKKYIIKRLINPKYEYSAKAWLAPKMAHHNVTEGTFKAGRDFNPDVKLEDGREMKLQDLWRLYEKDPAKYESALDFAVIRVPSDSVSGTRVLRFNGFTSAKGTAIHTSSRDNVYLGGADKDSDSVFLYQGLNRDLLRKIKKQSKEWQDKDNHWIEGKSDKYETLLRGERDERFETKASQFSPGMRLIVARNAAKGNDGLGYVMKAKTTMLSWIDILTANGGRIELEGGVVIKLKNDGTELRRLAREMINTSADAANYPNVTDYAKWREYLFDTAFEATIKGKKATFSQIVNKTKLGDSHTVQNVLDFKGKTYIKNRDPRAQTLDEFGMSIKKLGESSPEKTMNIYNRIARDAYKLGLHKDIKDKTVEFINNYVKAIEMTQKMINVTKKDVQEGRATQEQYDRAQWARDHLTKLVRVKIGNVEGLKKAIEKAIQTNDWERVLDFISNDAFLIATNNILNEKGYDIFKAFKENGINDPTSVMNDILVQIAKKATDIKRRFENITETDGDIRKTKFEDYDKEIQDFKIHLVQTAKDNKIDYKLLSDYFSAWLITPYKYGDFKTGSISRLPMQSQEVSSDVWKNVMDNFELQYQNITKRTEGLPIEKASLFQLPSDYKNPANKEEQGKLITDKVLENIIDNKSPIKKQATSDRQYTRKALSKEDFKEIEIFEANMKNGPDAHVDEFIGYFTLRYSKSGPKTISDLNMNDIKAINRFFRDYDRRFSEEGIPDYAYWADPRYIDEYMWYREMTFYTQGYDVTTQKGEVLPIYKGTGTLGTIRNWFRQTNRQMEVHTDAIMDINDALYPFRTQLTPNESWSIMRAIINKAQANQKGFVPFKIEGKYLERKYEIDGKKYTFEEAVDKWHDVMSKDLKKFGEEWLYSVDKNGEKIDWADIDVKQKYGEYNEYIKYNKDGSFDIMNFIRKAVEPGDTTGSRVPRIPLENIYRFQFEYNLEQQILGLGLKGKEAQQYRENYRKKVSKQTGKRKFKGIEEITMGEYFPHLDFGWNAAAKAEILQWKIAQGDAVYQAAIDKGLSPEVAEQLKNAKLAELDMKIEGSKSDTGAMEKHAVDEMLSKIDYRRLTPEEIAKELENIGFNTRPENLLERTAGMPGYKTTPEVIDIYKERVIRAHYRNLGSVMANYRINKFVNAKDKNGKPIMGEFTPEQYKKFNPDPDKPLYENWSDVWGDYLKFYVRDAFGHRTTFPERVIESMKHGDPLKLNDTMYMTMSDQKVIAAIEKIDKMFKKRGMSTPFLSRLPQITAKKGTPEYDKQVDARNQYLSRIVHDFGKLEARYELLTLLANTGTLTTNMFGGTTMTISSAGLRNFVRVNRFKWLKENVLFDELGRPTLTYINNQGKRVTVTDKAGLYKWIQDKGVIDNFINDELNTNIRLKTALDKAGRSGKEFIKDLKKLLRENPDASNETLLELAKRYGVQDTMLKLGGAFMQVSERKLRRDAFLSHLLQAKDRLGEAGKNMSLDDPYLVDAGLKGVEATQFLYHSAFRPAFMRTSLGKVMTRFKLFVFQSLRTRKELARRAQYYGYEKGTPDYERLKDLFVLDMLVLALASVYKYSVFDTALPPPYDWLQETSELVFGDKKERERAFFGTYPRAIAPLQIVTPPAARVVINPIKSLINNDWDRFLDYHIHTMYPFGRLVRQVDKTFYDPQSGRFEMINEQKYGTTFGRFMQQFFRLPTDKTVSLYDKAQLQKKREEMISQALGG